MATAKKSTPSPIPKQYESNPFNLITASIEAYKVNIRGLVYALVFVLGMLLFTVVPVVIGIAIVVADGGMNTGSLTLATVVGILTWLLLFFISAAYISGYLSVIMLAAAQGQRLGISEASKTALRLLPKLVVTGLLYNLIFVFGLILFIIPGLIFAAWFSLAPLAVIKEGLGPIAALRRSRELVRGHLVETWGLLGLQGTILGIVMLASMPIRYLQLDSLKRGDLKLTEVHWSNYVAILIGLAAGFTFNAPGPATQSEPPKDQPSIEQQIKDELNKSESL